MSRPDDERFGLRSQLRRAAVSVPANIVEGCARETERDYQRHLVIADASLREAGYLVDLATRLGYMSQEGGAALKSSYEETSMVMAGLIRSMSAVAR